MEKEHPYVRGRERMKRICDHCLEALSEERRITSFDAPRQLKILAILWNQAIDDGYSDAEKILIAQRIVRALENIRIP